MAVSITKKTVIAFFVLLYFTMLIVNCVYGVPAVDAIYYWDWGQHLALSYFDGPPMIAYMMRLSSELFGKHLFAINFIGPFSLAIESLLVYKAADVITRDRATALLAATLYVFNPYLTLRTIICPFNNQPFLIFYAATILSFCSYLRYQKSQYLYAVAVSVGLLILSRYNGVIIIISMLASLACQPDLFKKTLKSKHLYLAMLVTALIVSPIFIWNAQHHWFSIKYQMHQHLRPNHTVWFNLGVYVLAYCVTVGLSIFFLLYLKAKAKGGLTQGCPMKQFLVIDIVCTFVFWLYFSLHNIILYYYTFTSLIAIFILLADVLKRRQLKKLAIAGVVVFFVVGMKLGITNLIFIHQFDTSLTQNHLLQMRRAVKGVLAQLPGNAVLFTNDWGTSAWFSFWKPKDLSTHVLPNCGLANQYGIWENGSTQGLLKSRRPLYYVSTTKKTACLKPYPMHCVLQSDALYNTAKQGVMGEHGLRVPLYLYRCSV